MKRVFVCSPYRGDVAANVALAREACRVVRALGDAQLAPHHIYPDLLDDGDAEERALGMAAGQAWLLAADEVLVVGPVSDGMRAEIDTAIERGIPVRYADAPPAPRATTWRPLRTWIDELLRRVWHDRVVLAALVLLVLAFLLCPGCVASACRTSCPAPAVR